MCKSNQLRTKKWRINHKYGSIKHTTDTCMNFIYILFETNTKPKIVHTNFLKLAATSPIWLGVKQYVKLIFTFCNIIVFSYYTRINRFD